MRNCTLFPLNMSNSETKLSGFINICNIEGDPYGGLRQYFPNESLFQAPECFKEGLFSSYSADLWSLGVCLYFLVFGRSYIPLVSGLKLHETIMNYSTLPPMEGVSFELQELLSLMINPDVGKRPCLLAILVVLRKWYHSRNHLGSRSMVIILTRQRSKIRMNIYGFLIKTPYCAN